MDAVKLSRERGHELAMEITISDFGEAAKKVTLTGKLDIVGAEKIGLPLATVAGMRHDLVIDMVGVNFIASIGIRHLVMAAKAVARGAGRLVLLDPNPMVTEVLVVSGLEQSSPSCARKTRRGQRSVAPVPETCARAHAAEETAETRTFGVCPGDIAAIDDWIEEVGRTWSASASAVFAARLCVAELAANVAEHGITGCGDGRIIVTLRRCDDGIGIEFMDNGGAFNPALAAAAAAAAAAPGGRSVVPPGGPSDVASAAVGGRGLVLVRAFAHDLAYRHDGRCNRVTLKIKSASPDTARAEPRGAFNPP